MALAIAAERRLIEFKRQGLANTAWAFTTVKHRDEKILAALAIVAERRVSELNAQDVSSTAWAFATVKPGRESIRSPDENGGAAAEQAQ